jgi:hypothetical protein
MACCEEPACERAVFDGLDFESLDFEELEVNNRLLGFLFYLDEQAKGNDCNKVA